MTGVEFSKGLELIADLTKQLLTLATAILTLTVTFSKGVTERVDRGAVWVLKTAWVLYLLSILAGIWTMMAIAGSAMPIDAQAKHSADSARLPSALQIVLFAVATLCVVVVGLVAGLGNRGTSTRADT
jgi:hypothetical protein